jgi:hypothetical protein
VLKFQQAFSVIKSKFGGLYKMEYKCIRIKNKSLSNEEFKKVYDKVNKLDTGFFAEDNNSILFSGKSTKNKVYDINCGAFTSEYDSFILSLNYYLGNYKNDVEII